MISDLIKRGFGRDTILSNYYNHHCYRPSSTHTPNQNASAYLDQIETERCQHEAERLFNLLEMAVLDPKTRPVQSKTGLEMTTETASGQQGLAQGVNKTAKAKLETQCKLKNMLRNTHYVIKVPGCFYFIWGTDGNYGKVCTEPKIQARNFLA